MSIEGNSNYFKENKIKMINAGITALITIVIGMIIDYGVVT